MPTAHEILRSKGAAVHCVRPTDTVLSALGLMAELDIGALLVMNDAKLVGIFTERDLVQALASIGPSVLHLSIGDFMTREVQTCRSIDDLSTVRALMKTYAIRHVPVVDQGRLVESGRHADLLALGGVYARLYGLQGGSPEPALA